MSNAYNSEESLTQLMDDLQVIYTMKAGQVVTAEDVASLNRLDTHWRSEEESAVDAYHRGFQAGLQEGGGADVQHLTNKVSEKNIDVSVERTMRELERRRLIELLEPFATAARQLHPRFPDGAPVHLVLDDSGAKFYTLALGSLRAARTAFDADAADTTERPHPEGAK